jgi:hypothetical protein
MVPETALAFRPGGMVRLKWAPSSAILLGSNDTEQDQGRVPRADAPPSDRETARGT